MYTIELISNLTRTHMYMMELGEGFTSMAVVDCKERRLISEVRNDAVGVLGGRGRGEGERGRGGEGRGGEGERGRGGEGERGRGGEGERGRGLVIAWGVARRLEKTLVSLIPRLHFPAFYGVWE